MKFQSFFRFKIRSLPLFHGIKSNILARSSILGIYRLNLSASSKAVNHVCFPGMSAILNLIISHLLTSNSIQFGFNFILFTSQFGYCHIRL
ncbi:TPA: hypothetical protein DEG21_05605 [Patescibacteria group bacterium]|nr:hypothetical protein [Candidatus Gracilibacteria bacterium]HBY75297.1 hypothetical protein [Candidatus Gracilibacteria bacterium]